MFTRFAPHVGPELEHRPDQYLGWMAEKAPETEIMTKPYSRTLHSMNRP